MEQGGGTRPSTPSAAPRAPNKGRGLLRQGFGAAQRPKGAYRIAGQPRGRCPRSYGSASSTRCETAAGSILPLLGVQILLCSRGASPGEKSGREGGSAGTPGSGNRVRPPGSGVTVDGTGRWHLGGCSASLVFDGISAACPHGKKKKIIRVGSRRLNIPRSRPHCWWAPRRGW